MQGPNSQRGMPLWVGAYVVLVLLEILGPHSEALFHMVCNYPTAPLCRHHYPAKSSFLEPCPILPIQNFPLAQAPLPGETVIFCAFGGACASGGQGT